MVGLSDDVSGSLSVVVLFMKGNSVKRTVEVSWSGKSSLRSRIAHDEKRLAEFRLKFQRKNGRGGQASIVSTNRRETHGTIKISWNKDLKRLICQTSNQNGYQPEILKDFVAYLVDEYPDARISVSESREAER